jgi:hypothetical protein
LGAKLDRAENGPFGQAGTRLQELLDGLVGGQLLQDMLDPDQGYPHDRFAHHHTGIALD